MNCVWVVECLDGGKWLPWKPCLFKSAATNWVRSYRAEFGKAVKFRIRKYIPEER